jgi:ribonuclease VapC
MIVSHVADAVLDTSAIMAMLLEERGADIALQFADGAAVSANNIAEIATKLFERGMSPADVERDILQFRFDVHSVDDVTAFAIGALRPLTRSAGLSLGDRSCLALAAKLGLPAVTADKAWATIADAVGVEVRLIR